MSTPMLDVIARARGELRHHPLERRLRAERDGRTIVDSTRALLVWEPGRIVPGYAVPEDDIDAAVGSAAATDADVPPVLHPGVPFAIHTTPGEPLAIAGRDGAGFRFGDPGLAGYVALDFAAFDAWLEEDAQVLSHPRDPFHRIDVRATSRPVRIESEGELIADSGDARMLFETGLPVRFYLPRGDVEAAVTPSERTSYCPYKGRASYLSVDAGGGRLRDIGWCYERPLPESGAISGLVAFWNERVDVLLDGELLERPRGPIAAALREEFGIAA